MTRIINILGNSGSGKSVLALNLGIALSSLGKDTLLVDANIHSPDISLYSDLSPATYLNEFFRGERKIEDTITYHPSGLKVIPSIHDELDISIASGHLNEAILSLVGKSEIVLVDNLSSHPSHYTHIKDSDEALFVTNDDFPSISKSRDFIEKIEKKGITITGIILNRRRSITPKKHIESILQKKVLAEIPHDEGLIDSVNNKKPYYLSNSKSKISRELNGVASILAI